MSIHPSDSRFCTRLIMIEEVSKIPPNNDFGLTPVDCLKLSIRRVDGVDDVEITPSETNQLYWITVRKKWPYDFKKVLEDVDVAIKRCCDSSSRTAPRNVYA